MFLLNDWFAFQEVSCEAFGRWTLQSDFATWWNFSTVQLCRKTKGECNIPVFVLRQHGSKWFAWIERLSQTWKLLFTLTKVPWPVSSSGSPGLLTLPLILSFFYRSRLMIFRVILPWFQYRRPLNFFINGGGQSPSDCCVRWWQQIFHTQSLRQSREESQGHQYFFSMWRLNHGSQIAWMAIFERMWHAAVLCQGSEKEKRRAP